MKKSRLVVNLKLYKIAFLVRKCEEKIVDNYDSNEMKTPMHMSMGEEGITIGICNALRKEDLIFGTYRSHALYLTRSQDCFKFFCEMFGKVDGPIKGKGGSMHLSDPETGLIATSAVVSTTIPLAVGAAFSIKLKNTNTVAAVFFGDGAVDEGSFWESLNMACLFKVPVVFVCEDNGFAVHTPPNERHGYKSIIDIVSKFDCKIFTAETTDIEKINSLALKATNYARKNKKPVFIYLKYYRYLEHVGTHDDFEAGYRSRVEFQKWLKKDPVKLQREKLLTFGMTNENILEFENKISDEINKSFAKAKLADFPNSKELYKDVFYEK